MSIALVLPSEMVAKHLHVVSLASLGSYLYMYNQNSLSWSVLSRKYIRPINSPGMFSYTVAGYRPVLPPTKAMGPC